MNPDRLDAVARSLAVAGSRRKLIGMLAAIPAASGLLDILNPDDAAAKDRRRRRKQRHKKRKSAGSRKGKKCKPRSVAKTCAGKCGSIRNNCKKRVDCGACDCTPGCDVCFTCQGATGSPGTCVPQPDGTSCGAGQQCCAGRCSSTWTNQTTFGSAGTGPSQFDIPDSVAVSADELTLWVADQFNDRISIWTRPNATSSDWSNLTTFGSAGSGTSQFQNPLGLVVSADELTLWVADTFNSRISVWTRPDTTSLIWTNQTTFGSVGTGPSQFDRPIGVAVSADQLTLWVADGFNDRISVWTRPNAGSSDWTNQTTFGSEGSGPSQFASPLSVAVSADELTLWVVDTVNCRVSLWTRPNAGSTTWTNLTTFGSEGNGPSQFQFPFGVAVSADARTVWISDQSNKRISVWTQTCPA